MLRLLLVLSLISTSIFSKEIQHFPFIGVTVSSDSIDIQQSFQANNSGSDDTVALGLRYGMQTMDWRTMFTYKMASSDYQMFAVEVDKILMDSVFDIPEIRPYAGLTLGYINYDKLDNLDINTTDTTTTTDSTDSNSTSSIDLTPDKSGYFYGLNFGLLFYVTDNIDADIGYHYYFLDDYYGLNHVQGLTISFHYFY